MVLYNSHIPFEQGFSTVQLASILSTPGSGSSEESSGCGSVLQPPSIPGHLLHLYNVLATITYTSVLIFSLPALYGLRKVIFK